VRCRDRYRVIQNDKKKHGSSDVEEPCGFPELSGQYSWWLSVPPVLPSGVGICIHLTVDVSEPETDRDANLWNRNLICRLYSK